MTAKLIRNALQTPDGTLLESRFRHDYKTHVDANGKTYMIDGGLDYVRCSANGDEIHHCVWNDDPFDKVREAITWGTYGINGDQPLSYIKLCDMETEHIKAVLKLDRVYPEYIVAMKKELEHRDKS
tara:strand:+ start:117 stop:494 length:378 start_codon:yes stop_codon:yes gene_type:complete